ncbi:sugar transferase [Mycobacterium sp. ITM-2017-0098]|nr:sugar transferase [Mycobacterium sp. ITM-2017-0098]
MPDRKGRVAAVNGTVAFRRSANLSAIPAITAEARYNVGQLRQHSSWEPYVSALIDVSTASLAVAVGMTWAAWDGRELPPTWMMCFFAPTIVTMLALRGCYRRSLNRTFLDELPTIEAMTALAAMLLLCGLVLNTTITESSRGAVVQVWISAAVLIPAGRLAWITYKRYLYRRNVMTAGTLIVGNGRIAEKVIERINATPEYGLRPIGLIDDELPTMGIDRDQPSSIPYLGKLDAVEDIIVATGAVCMVVAFSRTRDEQIINAVRIAHKHDVTVWIVPRIFDTIGLHARIDHVGGLPLIAVSHTDPDSWQFPAKYVCDRIVAAVGLLMISPVFLALMMMVRLTSPGPIFLSQTRIGRDGREFGCLKFRSMRAPMESDTAALNSGSAPGGVDGEDRRTPIGKFMRATSLDDLPQLINVLRGQMSLVGPQPERPEYVDLFNIQLARYGDQHRVKAGITGWAQVHGLRGESSIADRAEWDNFYIENWSLWLDWKILAMTPWAILRRAR